MDGNGMAISDLLTKDGLALTPAEAKIVQALLADYPMSGLGTATSLARRAGVSDPTVARLVVKLGFDGYADFQTRLLAEVESRLHSPLLMMEAKRRPAQGNPAQGYLASVARRLDETVAGLPAQTYDRAADLVMETKRTIFVLGGRFSRHLAGMFAGYLAQFRRDVVDLGAFSAETLDRLVDIDRRDALVVFDYRRYQSDVVRFAVEASGRGARVLLLTDPWKSPISEYAEVVLTAPTEVDSPYDTLTPALAQLEALVAQLIARHGEATRKRIEAVEAIRAANDVTLDGPEDLAAVRRSRNGGPDADRTNAD